MLKIFNEQIRTKTQTLIILFHLKILEHIITKTHTIIILFNREFEFQVHETMLRSDIQYN